MRFLDTSTGQFVWVNDPSRVRYAILSHTWRAPKDGGEQTYDEVRKLQDGMAERVKNSTLSQLAQQSFDPANAADGHPSVLFHPHISEKIKRICMVAREAGYELVWIDSCCIDKSSSAELSEAINSMYELYSRADVCYAYISDVPDRGGEPTSWDSMFRKSRWFWRGWTLQELIAPKRVVFLTSTWRFLGTKMGLATTLEQITGIDFAILTGRASVDSVSVARRMSWAAGRDTTRVEDEAYSLMGLFGVHMSPIYGEGRNAFLRLQEEIIKTIPDQSVFAWGTTCTLFSLAEAAQTEFALSGNKLQERGLLANSPTDFTNTSRVIPLSQSEFVSAFGRMFADCDLPPLHCVFTPEGVRIQLLCIDLVSIPQVLDALLELHAEDLLYGGSGRGGTADTLALLRCKDSDGSLLALPLFRRIGSVEEPRNPRTGSSTGPSATYGHEVYAPFRTVRLTKGFLNALQENVNLSLATREVFIRRHASPSEQAGISKSYLRQGIFMEGRQIAISAAPWCAQELSAVGYTMSALTSASSESQRPGTRVLTATTTLSSYSTSRASETMEQIHIKVTLSDIREGKPLVDGWWLGTTSTSHVEISHDLYITPLAPAPDAPLVPRIFRASVCADGSPCTSPLDWKMSWDGALLSAVARAEFVIPAEAFQADHYVRLLRVTLEAKPDTPQSRSNTLRLSIETSEPYLCKSERRVDTSGKTEGPYAPSTPRTHESSPAHRQPSVSPTSSWRYWPRSIVRRLSYSK